MTFKQARDEYWKYYISLEEQFVETGRYVEFDYINNGKTYSMEYLKLYQAVCSEIDVVGKVLASIVDPTFIPTKDTGINEWWYHIYSVEPTIEGKNCSLFGEQTLQPWKKFKVVKNPNPGAKKYILDDVNKAKTPSWWTDYNSVKHNRTGIYQKHSTNYAKANLRNLFYAFSALFILDVKLMEKHRMSKETIPVEFESKLFTDQLSFYTYLLCVDQKWQESEDEE